MNASRSHAFSDIEAPAELETVKSTRSAGRMWLVRAAALGAVCLILIYPARALFVPDGVPAMVRWAWILAVAQALVFPRAAIVTFVAIVPLLGIVPSLARWPGVSLGEAWLWALLVAGWVGLVREPRQSAL